MSAFPFVILSGAKDLIAGSITGDAEAAMRSFAALRTTGSGYIS